jgi:hypothetical protein
MWRWMRDVTHVAQCPCLCLSLVEEEEEEEDVLLPWSQSGTSRYCTYVHRV